MFQGWPDEKMDGPDAIAAAIANLEPYASLSFGNSEALEKQHQYDDDHVAPCAIGSGEVP